jgi:hypothetical protein
MRGFVSSQPWTAAFRFLAVSSRNGQTVAFRHASPLVKPALQEIRSSILEPSAVPIANRTGGAEVGVVKSPGLIGAGPQPAVIRRFRECFGHCV